MGLTLKKIVVSLTLILASGCTPSDSNSDAISMPSGSSMPRGPGMPSEPLPADKPPLEERIVFYQPLPKVEEVIAGGIEKAAQTLRETYHKEVTPEDLIYLSRLLYKESGSNGESPQELKTGLEGVMHVIHNRWKFDNQQSGAGIPNNLAGKKRFGHGSLMSIIKDNPIEFSAISASPDYFQNKSFKNKKREYRLNPHSDAQVQAKLELCYQVVLEVLMGNSSDPTAGALFYHNPDTSTSKRLGAGKHMTTQVQEEKENGWRIRSEYRYKVVPRVRIGKHLFYNAEAEARVTRWNDAERRMEHYVDGVLKRECIRGKCRSY